MIGALIAVVVGVVIARADGATPKPDPFPKGAVVSRDAVTNPFPVLLRQIADAREKTHRCEQELGLELTPVSQEPISGREFARWARTLWRSRARVTCRLARALRDPRGAILAVFGPEHGPDAISVAECEGGLSPRATNGQYLGTFQMGSYPRSRYGHGDTVLEQAVAAHRYFVASGSDWSPWQCRPGGGLAW